MGNCCIHPSKSTMVWAEDDEMAWPENHGQVWYDAGNGHEHNNNMERQRLLSTGSGSSMLSDINDSGSRREMKIKITKRELEELMSRVQMQGLSKEQLFATLISNNSGGGDDHLIITDEEDQHHHKLSWKPSLKSIPEVN